MLFAGIKLVEGSELQNLIVDSGTAYPPSPTQGQLFYRTDLPNVGLYVFDGVDWIRIQDQTSTLPYTPVNKAGDTMLGALVLNTDPTVALGAATKQYVDNFQPAFSSISAKPTTLSGYGITDGQPLDSDLTAMANLTSNGLIVRTGNGLAATRIIQGSLGRISVTNGDAIAGNPVIDMVTVGTAGNYALVNTDAYGRVVSGSKPTTLAGFGIVDGQPLDLDLVAIAGLSGTSGILTKTAANTWSLDITQYAPITSPALVGIPTTPTAAPGASTTQIASTAFVSAAISTVTGGAVASANKWTTPRNLTLTGDATAALNSVDGSADVSAALTLATVNSTTGSFGSTTAIPVITVNGKGLVTNVTTASIGTLAAQSASAVAISGGAINGTTVGLSTPAAAKFTAVSLNGIGDFSGNSVSVPSTSPITVDSFSAATYRSVKYVAQISDGSNNEIVEFLLIHDGLNVFMTTYGNVFTGAASLGSFDANILSGTLSLTYTATAASSKTVKLVRATLTV